MNAPSTLLALVIGVIHAGLAPVLAMGEVRPNLILASVVTATALTGLGPGVLWAFVGGLTANLLTTDPLGSVPLGLLLAAGLMAGLGRLVGRYGAVLVLLGGVLGSLVVDLVGMVVVVLNGGASIQPASLVELLLPTAALNGLLAAVLFLPARAVLARFGFEPSAA